MDPSLITKYFSGRCTANELQQVLDWFQSPNGRAFLRKQIRKDCRRLSRNSSAFRCRDIDTQKVFSRILESINAGEQTTRSAGMCKNLAFEGKPLWKVSRQLENIYAINIEFQSDRLKKLTLTADFKQQKAEAILKAIATTLDIRCKKVRSNKFRWMLKSG